MKQKILEDSNICICDNISFSNIDEITIALDIGSGNYLELNATGQYIVNLIKSMESMTYKDLLKEISDNYRIDADILKPDIDTFIKTAVENKIFKLN